MHKRLWLVLSLLVVLFVPSNAMAVTPVESFVDGLTSWKQEKPEEVQSESEELQHVRQLASSTDGTVNTINGLVPQFYSIPLGARKRSPIEFIRFVLKGYYAPATFDESSLVVVVIAIVFFYWGLRKAVRMLFKTFRKGHINV